MINVIEKTSSIGRPASLRRRFAALVYELLLLAAVWFIAAFVFIAFARNPPHGALRAVFQLYLWLVTAAYFAWFWSHGGQTLAMKTWRIRLVRRSGEAVSLARAFARYGLATLSYGLAGLTLFWAIFDKDRQFLHDRLAGTRLIDARADSDALDVP